MNLNDFLDFVDFVKNAEALGKQVQVLKDENDRLETNIKLTSEIADIPRTKELTANLLEDARVTLDQAKKEAADVKEKAKTAYQKQLADVSEREGKAQDLLKEARQALKDAETLHATLIKDLAAQLEAVKQKEDVLVKTQAEVSERLDKLKSVMG